MPSRTAIVVLNYNGAEHTLECLDSLGRMRGDGFEIIVIDNGSTDDSFSMIRARHPSVQLLRSPDNQGYAGGNNLGIRHALALGVEYILILNNDTLVDPGLVEALTGAAERWPDFSIFGPEIRAYGDPGRLLFAGGMRWRDEYAAPRPVTGPIDPLPTERPLEVDFVSGCCLLARARVFRELGGFDPDYFLTWEEIEFCARARRLGHRCLFAPGAKVWHKGSVSFPGGERGPLRAYFEFRNRLRWLRQNRNLRARLGVYRRLVWKEALSQALALIRPGAGASQRLILRAALRGQWDYVLGRFGDAPASVYEITRRFAALEGMGR